jgi:hypothetical protein
MTRSIRLAGLLAVLVLAGCSTHPATPSPTPSITPVPSSTPTPTVAPSATPSPTPATVGLSAATLHPESVTFISPDVGWVLGLSLCGTASCLRLATTADAGTSWSWAAGAVPTSISPSRHWEVRFADSEDGWISGSHLYATHNGGRTWAEVAFPGVGASATIGALEAADGRVYAEVAEGTEPNTGGPVALFGSPTNVDSWHAIPGVTTGGAGFAGDISLAQGVFWVMLHPAVVTEQETVESSTLYSSSNGITWHSKAEPCPSSTVANVAAATAARVFVVCAGGGAAGSQFKTAYVSENAGATYRQVTDPPFGGDFESVAASPTNVSVASASGATEIDSSFNGGVSWAGTYLSGDGGLGLSDLGFTTATQGVVIHGQVLYPQSLQLLMTRDGGHMWAPVTVIPT